MITQAVESLTRAKDNKLYKHFSSKGHSHADMIIYVIETIHGTLPKTLDFGRQQHLILIPWLGSMG